MSFTDALTENSATAKVAEAIRAQIRDGHLTPRMRVPTEVALCRQVGVSRTTVRSAFRLLHNAGVIRPVAEGRGWEVVGDAGTGSVTGTAGGRGLLVGVVSELTMAGGPGSNHRSAGWSFLVLAGMLQALAEKGLTAAVRPMAALREEDMGARASYPAYLATHDAAVDHAVRARLEALRASGVPVAVQLDTESSLPFDQVLSDHAAGAEMLTAWLFARGCKKILVCFPDVEAVRDPQPWVELRWSGVERAHRAAAIAPGPRVPAFVMPVGYGTPERFQMQIDIAYGFLGRAFALATDWDAVMCVSDGETFAMAEALRRMGGRYADLPVVGYDNYWSDSPEFLWSGHKPAATVDKRNQMLGHETVSVLEARRADPACPDPIIRRVQPELRVLA